jgi:DNA-binding response OmpR family regulator
MVETSRARSVIVADDDADIRTLIAIAIERSGLELIDELSEGDSAWEAIEAFKPDMVVLDVAMPGKTGLEITRLIRADASVSGIPVILLSAGVGADSREAGLAAGATEYLTKPFSPRELSATISAVAARLG